MEYRRLGNTDPEVPAVRVGTRTLNPDWREEHSDAETVHLLQKACRLGVSLFDNVAHPEQGAWGERVVEGSEFPTHAA